MVHELPVISGVKSGDAAVCQACSSSRCCMFRTTLIFLVQALPGLFLIFGGPTLVSPDIVTLCSTCWLIG